jgi:uncharacterized OB-fold protein
MTSTPPRDEDVFANFHDVHIDRDNIEHYCGLMQRRLLINQCGDCGHWIYPHRPMCPACLSWNVTPTEVSGRGKLYMYTLLQQSRDPDAPLDAPLQIAAIELVEQAGLRYLSQVVDCPLEALQHDMPVELTWLEHGGRHWPAFRPVGGEAGRG